MRYNAPYCYFVDSLTSVEAVVNVDGLDNNKTMAVNLTQPVGIRYMSETKTNVEAQVGTEAQKTVSGVHMRNRFIFRTVPIGSDLKKVADLAQEKAKVRIEFLYVLC